MKHRIFKKLIASVTVICIILSCVFVASADVEPVFKMNKKNATIAKGETLKLKVVCDYNATWKDYDGVRDAVGFVIDQSTLKWKSSDKKVAKVSKRGKVTALKKGATKITVKGSGVKYTCKIKVENPRLNISRFTLKVNQGTNLDVLGTKCDIKWKSKDKSVATVDSDGLIKTVGKGETKIIATLDNTNKTKLKLKLTVKGKSKKYKYIGIATME